MLKRIDKDLDAVGGVKCLKLEASLKGDKRSCDTENFFAKRKKIELLGFVIIRKGKLVLNL